MGLTYVAGGRVADETSATSLQSAALNCAAGDLIVLWLKHEGAATTVSTISDSAGNTYQVGTWVHHGNGDLHGVFAWCLSSAANSSNRVAAALAAGRPYRRLIAMQFRPDSGEAVTMAAETGNQGNSGSPSIGNVTWTGTDGIAVGAFGEYDMQTISGATINAQAATLVPATGGDPYTQAWYRDQLASGFTGGAATSGYNAAWIAALAAFAAAAPDAMTVTGTGAASLPALAASATGAAVSPAPFPSTGVLDSFNRPDENPITGWLNPWSQHNDLQVINNQAAGTSNLAGVPGSNMGYWPADLGPDQEVWLTVAVPPNEAGRELDLFFRVPDQTADGDGEHTIDSHDYYLVIYCQGVNSDIYIVRQDHNYPPSYEISPKYSYAVQAGDSFGVRIVGHQATAYLRPSGGAWAPIPGVTADIGAYSPVYDHAQSHIAFDVNGTHIRIEEVGGGPVAHFAGALAASLPGPTATASGTAGVSAISGSGAASLPALTGAATGAQTFAAAGAASLPTLSASGSASLRFEGAVAASLPPLGASGVAAQAFSGAISAALPGLTAAAVGEAEQVGNYGAATLPALTAQASGAQTFGGAVSASLPGLGASAAGVQTFEGALSASLPGLTAAAAGEWVAIDRTGEIAATLPSLTATGIGALTFAGVIAGTLPLLTAHASEARPVTVPLSGRARDLTLDAATRDLTLAARARPLRLEVRR